MVDEDRCELSSECAFVAEQMQSMPRMVEIYRNNYCRGDASLCARHMTLTNLGKENVPPDLFPNDRARAIDILSARGISV